MPGGRVIPLAAKVCSGRCRSGKCGVRPNVWVLAACGGMAALFQKQGDGSLAPLLDCGSNISSFADGMSDRLVSASENAEFGQLVLVGSANDISWMQTSLPRAAAKRVVAEIEYPLMSAWFEKPADIAKLTQALENVFHS